jgi:hypothetical protein
MNNPVADLETLWERLADGIDRAGDKEVLFLAKLALLLGNELQNLPKVEQLIARALEDLN